MSTFYDNRHQQFFWNFILLFSSFQSRIGFHSHCILPEDSFPLASLWKGDGLHNVRVSKSFITLPNRLNFCLLSKLKRSENKSWPLTCMLPGVHNGCHLLLHGCDEVTIGECWLVCDWHPPYKSTWIVLIWKNRSVHMVYAWGHVAVLHIKVVNLFVHFFVRRHKIGMMWLARRKKYRFY